MRFQPVIANNVVRRTQTRVWLPDETALTPPNSSLEEGFLRTVIGSEPRVLDYRLVEMALKFNRSRKFREYLGHDSAVFAYACLIDDPLENTRFGQLDGLAIDYAETEFWVDTDPSNEDDPPFSSGEIALVGREDPNGSPYNKIAHCMVRANTDIGESLYLSKLGLSGSVFLSTYESMAEYFDSDIVGRVVGLHARDYRPPEA